MITKEEMKRLTRSEDCSDIKVDSLYLPWTMMKWNFVGEIREYNIDKSNLCSTTDNSVLVFFPSKGGEGVKNTILTSSFFNPSFHNFFLSTELFQWEECMVTCPKLNKAQTPPSNTLEELEVLRQLSNKFQNFSGIPSASLWMSVTDAAEEGVWRDHYTGKEASQNVLEREVGGLKKNTDQNCGLVS